MTADFPFYVSPSNFYPTWPRCFHHLLCRHPALRIFLRLLPSVWLTAVPTKHTTMRDRNRTPTHWECSTGLTPPSVQVTSTTIGLLSDGSLRNNPPSTSHALYVWNVINLNQTWVTGSGGIVQGKGHPQIVGRRFPCPQNRTGRLCSFGKISAITPLISIPIARD